MLWLQPASEEEKVPISLNCLIYLSELRIHKSNFQRVFCRWLHRELHKPGLRDSFHVEPGWNFDVGLSRHLLHLQKIGPYLQPAQLRSRTHATKLRGNNWSASNTILFPTQVYCQYCPAKPTLDHFAGWTSVNAATATPTLRPSAWNLSRKKRKRLQSFTIYRSGF